jgi:peroxiredoxin
LKRTVFLLTTLFALAIAANAQGLAVGSVLEGFSLPDLDGRVQALDNLRGRNGTVLIFLSAQCPAVKDYKDRINYMAAQARGVGVNFIGLNSNSTESPALIRSNAAQFGYRFPVLLDMGDRVADRFDARTAPEVFFFNGENVLLYRGAIDNDRSGSTVTDSYLTAALNASLTGKPIFKKSVQALGCPIKRVGM